MHQKEKTPWVINALIVLALGYAYDWYDKNYVIHTVPEPYVYEDYGKTHKIIPIYKTGKISHGFDITEDNGESIFVRYGFNTPQNYYEYRNKMACAEIAESYRFKKTAPDVKHHVYTIINLSNPEDCKSKE
jgi:hypothetical protein